MTKTDWTFVVISWVALIAIVVYSDVFHDVLEEEPPPGLVETVPPPPEPEPEPEPQQTPIGRCESAVEFGSRLPVAPIQDWSDEELAEAILSVRGCIADGKDEFIGTLGNLAAEQLRRRFPR